MIKMKSIDQITRRMEGRECAPALAGSASDLLNGVYCQGPDAVAPNPWSIVLYAGDRGGVASADGAPTEIRFDLRYEGGRLRSTVPDPPADGWRAWAAAWRAAVGLPALTADDHAYERMSYADRSAEDVRRFVVREHLAGRMTHRPELVPS